MSARGLRALVAALLVLTSAEACGKRGNPLAPLRPFPGRVLDLAARRTGNRVELSWTVPAANTDGSTPSSVDRIEIYAAFVAPGPPPPPGLLGLPIVLGLTRVSSLPGAPAARGTANGPAPPTAPVAPTAPGAPSPTGGRDLPLGPGVIPGSGGSGASGPAAAPGASGPTGGQGATSVPGARGAAGPVVGLGAQTAGDPKNLRGQVRMRPPAALTPAMPGAASTLPAPGERATFSEVVDAGRAGNAVAVNYVIVGVTSGGRGRRGPLSAVVTVPLNTTPAAPTAVAAAYSETTLTISWTPASVRTVEVLASEGASFDAATAKVLTPKPIDTPRVTLPVEFGRPRCFAVHTVQVAGAVTVEGRTSTPACLTPVDHFPPPAPTDLQAIQEGTVITLNWTAVDVSDLAGYIILRGDASGETLLPLMRVPITETTFKDVNVQAGVTYTYSVYAEDKAPTPNVSQQSNRQVVTVR